MSYQELDARANQLAHALQQRGVGPETLVAVCLERSATVVVALLGILKAGGAYVPIDPAYPPERQALMLEDTQAPLILSQTSLTAKLPPSTAELICLDQAGPMLAVHPAEAPAQAGGPAHVAYMIYTSGSTGRPKGVAITHQSAVAMIAWAHQLFTFEELSGVLASTSLCFDLSIFELFVPLSIGGCVIGVENALHLGEAPARDRVTLINTVPSAIAELVRSGDIPPNVQTVNLAGEPIKPSLVKAVYQQAGVRRVYNLYGPSEDTTYSTWALLDPTSIAAPPIGRPISNSQAYVLDAQLMPVPIGVVGELYLGGDGLARGYLNRPELTAERFIPNPFALNDKVTGRQGDKVIEAAEDVTLSPLHHVTVSGPSAVGGRLYKTGDRVRWRADGQLEFLGRRDTQVKLRGFRIELGEIERTLERHSAIRHAVVIVHPGLADQPQLVAYVVPKQEPRTKNRESTADKVTGHIERSDSARSPVHPFAPSQQELRGYLQRHLPEYMVPTQYVLLDALPLTPNGKVNHSALPAPTMAPIEHARYLAPRTPVELILADIWSQVFAHTAISIDANFFALGGHSLLATQVVARIRSICQVNLPLRALFETPTIAGLAVQIEAAQHGEQGGLPRLSPADRGRPLPLSYAQQRLWFLDQLEPNQPFYNIPLSLRLRGALNQVALEASLTALVARHEALRTTFVLQGDAPVQQIAAPASVSLPCESLAAIPAAEREAAARAEATAEAQRPFDLARGPLARFRLLQIDADDHVLLLTCHHSIIDGWSLGVLLHELTSGYRAASSGGALDMTPLPLQYADYAVWQRAWLQDHTRTQLLNYWTTQLAGSPPLLELPTDFPRPAVQTFSGAHITRQLPARLTQALRRLSLQADATLFMTLLAAWQVLLARSTGQNDIVVGSPIAGRTSTELEGMIGFFANTIVLRSDLSDNPTFATLLGRVRATTLGAYAHQDLPFEQLVEALAPERSRSHAALFQVMFAMQPHRPLDLELPDVQVQTFVNTGAGAKFDLTLNVEEEADGLYAHLEYSSDLFSAATMERMLDQWETLLASIAAAPQQRVDRLELLPPAERATLLHTWNQTALPYPAEQTIIELIAAQVARTPDAIAVRAGEGQVSYRALNARANQLAHELQQHGIGPDTLVGVCLPRSLDLLVALLGTLKAGAAYLPLDPEYPSDRLAFMIADSQVRVLITRQDLQAHLPPHGAHTLFMDAGWPGVAQQPATEPPCAALPEHLAYMIYTSGSTGRPNGVMVSHRNLVHSTVARQHDYGEPFYSLLVLSSSGFDSLITGLFWTLCSGAALCLAPEGVQRDPEQITALIAQQQFSHMLCLPTLYQLLLDQASAAELQSLRAVIVAGEECPPTLVERHYRLASTAVLSNEYGPTEATAWNSVYRCRAHEPLSIVPIGRPIANSQVYVLDPQLAPVPVGVAGELYLGGEGLARGYFGRPDLTAERFVPNPFSPTTDDREPRTTQRVPDQEPRTGIGSPAHPLTRSPAHSGGPWSVVGGRLYRTGDRVRWRTDGHLEFLGRVDQQVKVRGYRIELDEIARMLAQHPAVHSVVVLLRERSKLAQQLVAYVVPNIDESGSRIADGAALSSQLRSFLQTQLPEYMVPAQYMFLDALPLTPNGKTDRDALAAIETTPAAARDESDTPRDALELQLANIWEDVLERYPIGINEDFFQLGGHSIAAVRVIARIAQQLGHRLPLAVFFQGATIKQLAEVLRQQTDRRPESPVVALQPRGTKRPLFFVHPLGGQVFHYRDLAYHLGTDQPFYAFQDLGYDQETDPYVSIETLASSYVATMRQIQPTGPYLIGGHSYGGPVAFEMAQQLAQQDQEVALLAIFDTVSPRIGKLVGLADDAMLLAEMMDLDLSESIEHLRGLNAAEQVAYVLEQIHATSWGRELGAAWIERRLAVFKARSQALNDYQAQVYPGQITLFRAHESRTTMVETLGILQAALADQAHAIGQPDSTTVDHSVDAASQHERAQQIDQFLQVIDRDPSWGWDDLSHKPVSVQIVPGGHASMLFEPHVAALTHTLNACLE